MESITTELEKGALTADTALKILENMINNPDNGSQWVGHAKRVRKILQNILEFRQPTQLEFALAFGSAGFAPAAFRSKIIQWSKNKAFCDLQGKDETVGKRKFEI